MKELFVVSEEEKLVFDFSPLGFFLLLRLLIKLSVVEKLKVKKRRRHCVLFIEAMVEDKMPLYKIVAE